MDIITQNEADAYLKDQLRDMTPASGTPASLISDVSRRICQFLNRKDFGPQESRTEYYDGGSQILQVKVWPVVSVTGIWDDTEHVWNASSQLDSTGYWISQNSSLELNDGTIYYTWGRFVEGFQNVKITYTGGYNSVDDIPTVFKDAAKMQVCYETQMFSAISFANTPAKLNGTETDQARDLGLLSAVRQILDPYVRRVHFA
jgi:hypothetical protein